MLTDHSNLARAGLCAASESAPPFELTGIDGQPFRLSDYAGSIVVLDFWSAQCPWSQHYDAWLAGSQSQPAPQPTAAHWCARDQRRQAERL